MFHILTQCVPTLSAMIIGAALSELYRWALKTEGGVVSTVALLVRDSEPCGWVARNLGITQVDDSE